MKRFLPLAFSFALGLSALTASAVEPLKVLLITGGCCHDYAAQKDILKKGIEERANVVVTQVHTDDKSTTPPLAILGKPDYANGYDVVIHDECAAGVKDVKTVEDVLKPHRDGIPGVNLHCAMHCYRTAANVGEPQKAGTPESLWFDYLGLQSSGHGPQMPIDLTAVDKGSPILKGFSDWTTIKEELYNNIQIFPETKALLKGHQIQPQKDGTTKEAETVVAWTNLYLGKTRVFSTTIGHNNETVSDARYLNLVTNGVLWAAGKLNDDGTPAEGYGKK